MTETPTLDRIIDSAIPKPAEPVGWSLAEERRFRALMSKCKTVAKIVNGNLWLRPQKPGEFEHFLKTEGLSTCQTAMEIAKAVNSGADVHCTKLTACIFISFFAQKLAHCGFSVGMR